MDVIDDRYQVIERVDRRERSELLRVEDRLRPGRILMLKLLRPSSEEERQAFANDFRVRAGLRHRGVARVYEYGTDETSGSPYYTGEWIGGRPWDEVAPAADPRLLFRLCADVCCILDHCHARDLLHLDLKPDNLLIVDEEGGVRAKVLDFGLARGRSRQRAPGGTPIYMAPELLEGKAFDGRADLYSLGISLLPPSGRPEVPGYPREGGPPADWPRALRTLVSRLIDRDPEARLGSARAVLTHIERAGVLPADELRALREGEIPFAGRGVTMMRLREAYRRHFAGERDAVRGVLLAGEPGVGKTRVLREFRATVTTLPPVVVGGDPYAEEVPFAPLGDPLARLWQRKEIRESSGGPFGLALAALLPGLRPAPTADAVAPSGHDDLVRAVTDFLVEAGRPKPGTLFLDDVDRGDGVAMEILRALLLRDDNPWFVVCTARGPVDLPGADRIVLDGLDDRAIEAMLRARFGDLSIDPGLVPRLHSITGGNPSFVELLLGHLRVDSKDGGAERLVLTELESVETPADLAESIRQRQASLTREQRTSLGFLALAGRAMTLEAICGALEVEESDQGTLLEGLVGQGLVRREGAGREARYRFDAEHHAATTYETLPDTVRRKHHAAAARLLTHVEDVDDLRDLARHLASSGEPGKAAEVLLRAANRARARFAHDSAEGLLRRAVATVPVDDLRLRAQIGIALGDLMVHLGRYRAASDAYWDVERLDPSAVGPAVMGRLALHQGGLAMKTGERSLGLTLLERSVGYLEGTGPCEDLARAYKELADAFMAEDIERARRYCDLALGNLAADAPQHETAALHLLSGELAAMSGDYEAGIEDVGTAVRLFRAAGASPEELAALDVQGRMLRDIGDPQAALQVTQRAVEWAERTGDRNQYARVLIGHGDGLWHAGEYAQALDAYLKALDLATEIGHPIQEATARKRLGRLYSYAGNPDRAQEELQRSILLFDASNDRLAAGEARVWLAGTRLRVGEREGLSALLGRAERELAAVQLERGLQSARVVRAAVALRQGRHDEAGTELRELMEASPLPEVACTMHRLRARLERLRPGGDLPAAYGYAREALAEADRAANPDARWRSLAELTVVCASLDDREQAEEQFGELQQLADWIQARIPEGIDATHPVHRAVGRLARELGVAALPPETLTADTSDDQQRDRMQRLVDTLRELAAHQDPRILLDRLLALALEVTGAERGLMRLRDGNGRALIYSTPEPFPTSDRLLDGVLRTGQATWTANAHTDRRFVDSASVMAHRLRSVLCAPMRMGSRLEGVLYVDHPFLDAAFGPGELTLLEAVAAQAAMVARTERTIQETQRLREDNEELRGKLVATAPPPAAEPAWGAQAPTAPSAGWPTASTPDADASKLMPPTPAPDLRRGQLNHRYEEIVGDHPSLVLALQTIDHIVETEIPVYVHGESGTGKELFARAIHFNGPRKDGAFMALNCAAVPEQLLESELFGHVRGAFTGATADRKGLFEMADDGTLFLDEVGDMSLAMQAKLLRVLQEGEVRRVGSARTKKVDVRVVAASHQDLAALVEKGDFRQDVYYRLCAITVKIPALRERRSDIPLLLQYFLAAESAERGAAAPAIDPRVAEVLGSLEWPGNVRQLLNVVRTAWALGGGRQIGAAEVSMALGQPHPSLMAVPPSGSPVAGPPAAGAPSPPPQDFPFQPPASPASDSYNLADRERQAIMAAIQQAGGNKVQAAKNLGISRRTLYRKIERYGIKDQV